MGLLKSKLRERIATRGDVDAIRADLTKLRRQVGNLPDLGEFGRRLRDLAKQLTSHETKLAKQDARLTKQDAKLTGQGTMLTNQGSTLSKNTSDIRLLQTRVGVLTVDYERMAQQLAATETRIELLRRQVDPTVFTGAPADHAEAQGLIDEIRREHDQIRVRFQVMSNYEERLSRVEEILASVPDMASS